MSRKNNSDSKNSEVPAGSFEQVFEMSPVLPGRSARPFCRVRGCATRIVLHDAGCLFDDSLTTAETACG